MSNDNIVLVTWDSARADHLPMYGYARNTTPYLSDIANNGLIFENAYVPGVGTPTSFGGMFSGDYINAIQDYHGPQNWRPALEERRLLPEVLSDAGYDTGGIHANALLSSEYGWNKGWDTYGDSKWTKVEENDENEDNNWGEIKKDVLLPFFQRLGVGGKAIHARNILFKHEAYTPWEDLFGEIQSFLNGAEEPWFLWVLLIDTHHPWYAPEQYHEWSQPGFRRSHFWSYAMRFHPEWAGERHPGIINAYDNELRHADAFLRKLDIELSDRECDDAALIMHSDHGDDLGEHGRYGHAPRMYDTVTHVPLIMRNVGRTGRISKPVTQLSLSNTVLDIADIDERLGDQPSLLQSPDDDPVIIENFRKGGEMMAAAVDKEWKVLYHPDDGWEAYHRVTDQYEKENKWGDHPSSLENEVRTHIEQRMQQYPDVESQAQSEEDELRDVRENLTNLGYLE